MIGRILHAVAARRLRAIRFLASDPAAVQRETLLRLVRTAARTRFGREHGFNAIRSVEDFRARVPLQDYASMLPWFERARDHARDETWPGVPSSFAMTSGTTGGNKYLPHSESSIRSSMRGGNDALCAYLVRAGDRHLMRARIAFLGGSVALDRFPSGMPWGDNTGILAARAPVWVRPFRVPSPKTLALGNWETKLARAAEELARRDVRLLLGVPSWALLLMDAIEERAQRPIRDVWPSWRGFIHGGMAFGPYAETYRRRVGEGVVFVDTYTATEGGMLAIQDRNDDPAMVVIADRNVFYEFVPAGDPEGPRLGLHEVEPDVPYIVCVSTDAGIWAYRIGDVVRFAETRPARLVFHGRQKFFLNAFGEHVSQEELERALAVAAQRCGGEVREFTVLPEYPDAHNSSGRHAWLVEFVLPPPDVDAFARAIDEAICEVNDDYKSHRTGSIQLRPPVVRLVRPGGFYEWMKARGRLGGQNKVPRIVDAGLAEGLLRPPPSIAG